MMPRSGLMAALALCVALGGCLVEGEDPYPARGPLDVPDAAPAPPRPARDADEGRPDGGEPGPGLAEVEPILERSCGACHGGSPRLGTPASPTDAAPPEAWYAAAARP